MKAPGEYIREAAGDTSADAGKTPPELSALGQQLGIDLSSLGGAGLNSRSSLFGVEGVEEVPVRLRNLKQYLPMRGDVESGAPGLQGPDNSTVLGTLTNFYRLRPSEVVRLKQRLWAGGFYEGNTPPALTADPDEATFAAYRKAVLRAARSGESLWDDILTKKEGDESINRVNPKDIALLNETSIPEAIGRKLNDDELARFTAALNDIDDAGYAPASADAQIMSAVQTAAPGATEEHGVLKRMAEFISMLEEPSGGAA